MHLESHENVSDKIKTAPKKSHATRKTYDNVTAANNNSLLARHGNASRLDQLNDSLGGAGDEGWLGSALGQVTNVDGVEAGVHIFKVFALVPNCEFQLALLAFSAFVILTHRRPSWGQWPR